MGETGMTSVHQSGKVAASKGVRQVVKMTNGERGATVTVICAVSAAGAYLPPFMIFPRKRMVDQLMQGAPPQSVGHASASEWWTSSCRVPRHSQSATPVQANGGPAHAGCPATVSRPRQCKRMVDQLMQGAPPQSVGHASASEWWTSSCRVPRHSQSATPVQAVGQMPDSF